MQMRGRIWLGVCCACTLLYCVPSSRAQSEGHDSVGAVDSLMHRWVQLEQQSNAIESNWREQKPVLEQRLVLLDKERAALTKTLEQTKTTRNDVEQKRLELVEQQTSLERDQEQVHRTLEAVVADLEDMSRRLPPPVQNAWKDGLPKLRDGSLDDGKRLQTVVDMLTALDDFRRKLSVSQAIVNAEDGRYLVRQAYLGLARGWYVNADGTRAAHGFATHEGWVWKKSEDGVTIARLIDIAQARRSADLLSVPVELAVGPAKGETAEPPAAAPEAPGNNEERGP